MENLTRRDKEKKVREEEIISSAEKIFFQKGFDNASMDEIAKEAQFTKRTLYQYFGNKEDLYFAVVLKGFKKLFLYFKETCENENNGYKRIKLLGRCYYRFYRENPEILRIMGYLGYVRKRSGETQNYSEFMKINNDIFHLVSQVISGGIEDGSVKDDLNVEKTTLSMIFLMTGFFNQLSTTGNSFTEHFSLDIEDFSFFTMDMLLESLKRI